MTVASIGGPRHFDAMVGHMMTKYSIEHRGVWSRGVKRGVAPMKREYVAALYGDVEKWDREVRSCAPVLLCSCAPVLLWSSVPVDAAVMFE